MLPEQPGDADELGNDGTAAAEAPSDRVRGQGRPRGQDRDKGRGKGRGGGRGRGRNDDGDKRSAVDVDAGSPEHSPSVAAPMPLARRAPRQGGARGGRGRGRGPSGYRASPKVDRPNSGVDASADTPAQSGSDESEAESDSDDIVCAICNNGRYTDKNQIVLCDNCNRAFHQRCHRPAIKPGANGGLEVKGCKRGLS